MIKELAKCIREYKKASILTPVLVSIEVVMECLIPFIIAHLVTLISDNCEFKTIALYGGLLALMAVVSLTFGALAGKTCATASCGLAKNLRKNATPQENHLWYDFLSKYKVKFQRQKAIDNFIADFYCHKAKLIIEIDGAQHYTEKSIHNDDFRTEILKGYDLKVIRFTNCQIDKNFLGVCKYIDSAVKASLREGGGAAKP